MTLQTAASAETSVMLEKFVSLDHARLVRITHIVMGKRLIQQWIPQTAASAEECVLWGKYVSLANALLEQV